MEFLDNLQARMLYGCVGQGVHGGYNTSQLRLLNSGSLGLSVDLVPSIDHIDKTYIRM